MYFIKITLSIVLYIFLILTFIIVSLGFNLKGNIIFFLISSIVLISFIFLYKKSINRENVERLPFNKM